MGLPNAYGGGAQSPAEYLREYGLPFAAVAGAVPGVWAVRKFGFNPDVDSGTTPETIWPVGGLYPFETSSYAAEILSSSADDAAAGDGIQTVRVQGLDANWDEQSEDLTMDGVTPVASANTWRRIFRAFGLTSGVDGVNAGTITIRIPGPGNTQAVIAIGDGQTLQAHYTVPAGRTGFVFDWNLSVTDEQSAGSVTSHLRTRENRLGTEPVRVRSVAGPKDVGTSEARKTMPVPILVSEKTDIEARVVAAAANNIAVASEFAVLMVKTSLLP